MKIDSYIHDIAWKGFKNPDPVEEDPEAQQAALADKDIAGTMDVYNPYQVESNSIITEDILEVCDYLEQTNTYMPSIKRSFKHITLPEALVYIFILENPETLINAVNLRVDQTKTTRFLLQLNVHIMSNHKEIQRYTIQFNYRNLEALIFDGNKRLGSVTYIIRGQKCEEIQGKFNKKPFILDPVWSATKKGKLKEEYFRYGNIKTTLIYQANQKHSSLNTFIKSPTFSMTHKRAKKDKNRRYVTKSVTCQHTTFHLSLVFHRKVLIPISGEWKRIEA